MRGIAAEKIVSQLVNNYFNLSQMTGDSSVKLSDTTDENSGGDKCFFPFLLLVFSNRSKH